MLKPSCQRIAAAKNRGRFGNNKLTLFSSKTLRLIYALQAAQPASGEGQLYAPARATVKVICRRELSCKAAMAAATFAFRNDRAIQDCVGRGGLALHTQHTREVGQTNGSSSRA